MLNALRLTYFDVLGSNRLTYFDVFGSTDAGVKQETHIPQ